MSTLQDFAQSRRDFLKSTLTVGGGLLLGVTLPGTQGQALAKGSIASPNAWVHIADDNTMTLISARSEMGQGVYTALPMLIAEELNVDPQQVKVSIAPPGAVYTNALLGAQITGGSTSVREGWDKLRIAGAQMREMLIAAAAQRWHVPTDKVRADGGYILGPGQLRGSYGDFAQAAAKLPLPESPALKQPKDFRVVGTRLPRLDTPVKVNGTAEFGIDVKLPGMVFAALEQCPVIGGKVVAFDAGRARKMQGVVDVVQIPDGVAVVAQSWWQAKQARDALKITWDEGAGKALSDASILEATRAALSSTPAIPIKQAQGDVAATFAAAKQIHEAEYVTPLQAHAALEPMNFTAHVSGDKALLIGPTQFQQGAQGAVAAALGVKPETVTLQTTFLGGGFGRRLELDFIVQAAQISKVVQKPVKLIWSREDDMTHDFYRPVGVNQLKAALDANGKPEAWHFRVASQSITQRAFGLPKKTLDPFMAEASVSPYKVANQQHDLVIHHSGLRAGYWRAVSHNMNAFANESFIDELATLAKQDPYAYRLSLLNPASRYAAVLKLAASKAGWGKKLPRGRAHGIALMEGYGTYMAQVAEVSRGAGGEITVHRMTVAADLGMMVNPDIVEAQIESSIVFGLGATLKHSIHLQRGRVQEQNFDSFAPIRMREMPQIDIHLVNSDEKPGGIGEPATALVAPAVANAVAALTGERIRSLPIGSVRA